MESFILIFLSLIILLIIARCVRIVPQAHAYVIERLGAYSTTWAVGIHFKIPFIERISNKTSLKEMILDFPPQSVITKDNVAMKIDTVIYFQVTDPKLFTYGMHNPIGAIETLTATTLRNIIGQLELDETLTSRDHINTSMRAILDEVTDPWGIKVNRVEVKNIIPPADIQESMEKQMRAERERRESIIRAEGEKASRILVAEGKKEAAILDAEGSKQAVILNAEAQRESVIRQAEGEAEAILKVQQAQADGIKLLKDAGADQAVLALKSFETLAKVADGKATKLIIPSQIQDMASTIAALTEAVGLGSGKDHNNYEAAKLVEENRAESVKEVNRIEQERHDSL